MKTSENSQFRFEERIEIRREKYIIQNLFSYNPTVFSKRAEHSLHP